MSCSHRPGVACDSHPYFTVQDAVEWQVTLGMSEHKARQWVTTHLSMRFYEQHPHCRDVIRAVTDVDLTENGRSTRLQLTPARIGPWRPGR